MIHYQSEYYNDILIAINSSRIANKISKISYCSLTVKWGSLQESHNGIAHFLEHMLVIFDKKINFKYPYRLLATTAFDRTTYIILSTQDGLEQSIQMLSLIMNGDFLQNQYMEEIRKDILKEYDFKQKSIASNMEYSLLYSIAPHIACKIPIGDRESILSLTINDLEREFKSAYMFSNMEISLSSGIPYDKSISILKEALLKKNNQLFSTSLPKTCHEYQQRFYPEMLSRNCAEIYFQLPYINSPSDRIIEFICEKVLSSILSFVSSPDIDARLGIKVFTRNMRFLNIQLIPRRSTKQISYSDLKTLLDFIYDELNNIYKSERRYCAYLLDVKKYIISIQNDIYRSFKMIEDYFIFEMTTSGISFINNYPKGNQVTILYNKAIRHLNTMSAFLVYYDQEHNIICQNAE